MTDLAHDASWLTPPPPGWVVTRLAYVSSAIQTGPFGSQLHAEDYIGGGVPLINPSHIKEGRLHPDEKDSISEPTAERLSRHRMRKGEVVFGRRGELGRCAVVRPEHHGWLCGTGSMVVRPIARMIDPEYLQLAASLSGAREWLQLQSVGSTMDNLNASILGRLPIPLPAIGTQRRIVGALREKTVAADALIAKKERLIDLLQEKRQALITQAVTKGLDPNVPMKESGIDWVGSMPSYWKTARISYLADVCNGSTPDRNRQDYWTAGTVPWLSSGKVNDYIVEQADELITERALRETSVRLLPKGTVLVGMVGQGKTRGMSAIMELSACINQNVAGLTPGPAIDGRFLHHILVAAYLPLRECGRGGQQDALNCEILKAFRLPLPPLEEQRLIARHLDEDRVRMAGLRRLIEQHVDKLREYRQALITAAVTGKIDVSKEPS